MHKTATGMLYRLWAAGRRHALSHLRGVWPGLGAVAQGQQALPGGFWGSVLGGLAGQV